MHSESNKILVESIKRLLRRDATSHLLKIVKKTHAADLASVFDFLSINNQRRLFKLIDNVSLKGEIFSNLDEDTFLGLVDGMNLDDIVEILDLMPRDDVADLLGCMPIEKSDAILEKMKKEGFRKMLKNQFIKHTDACVEDFLNGDIKSLFNNTKKLSKVVLNHFKPMIPAQFHELWKKGIETNDYYLKLCGSGGGGYILGFTEDIEKAKASLSGFKLEVVYNF